MAQDALGNASQQGAPYACPSMTADDDQVSRPVLCSTYNLGNRGAYLNELQHDRLLREAFTKVADQFSCAFFGRGFQYSRLNTRIGGVCERRVDDMNERHLGPRKTGQLCADISRMSRDWLTVDRNEDFSKDHNNPL